MHHEETVAGVTTALRRMLKLQPAPTAVLVGHPHYYLAVASRLAASGVRVPEDISLVSRDDDPFLSFLVPSPARYVVKPHVMAKSLLRPVLELLEGNPIAQPAARIMPEFFRGESIAAPSAQRA
jgi:LacI family transcriptional regulator